MITDCFFLHACKKQKMWDQIPFLNAFYIVKLEFLIFSIEKCKKILIKQWKYDIMQAWLHPGRSMHK